MVRPLPHSHPFHQSQPLSIPNHNSSLTHDSNCSICLKTNRLSVQVPNPDTQFHLISPGSLSDVPEYQFNSKSQHHHFCDKCGIHPFSYGSYVWEGKEVKNFSINAVTMDPDQGVDLRAFKVSYWDGKGENWGAGMAEKPYPGGAY